METPSESGNTQQNHQMYQNLSQNAQSSQHNSTRTYSNVTKTTNSIIQPEDEQAIVMNVNDELKLVDYVSKIASFIGPKNILFASRISKNRICMYLSNVQLVEKIVQEHHETDINGYQITIRKLVTPARRIILSNVRPAIPNELLEETIKNIGFTTASPVSFLKASLGKDVFSHILSFRRQIYIQPNDSLDLPSSILLKHNNREHRIFLTYDELICFTCKQTGHIASRCPIQNIHTQKTNDNASNDTPITSNTNQNTPQNSEIDLITLEAMELDNLPLIENPLEETTTKKRPRSPGSSLTENQPIELDCTQEVVKEIAQKETFLVPKMKAKSKTEKRLKKSNSIDNENTSESPNKSSKIDTTPKTKTTETVAQGNLRRTDSQESLKPIEDLLLPIKDEIDNTLPPLILNFEQICDFFENTHGNPDPLSVARLYTDNIPAILDMLQWLHSQVKTRGIKTKCTRLKKRISKQLEQDTIGTSSDNETDSSQKSSY